MVTRLQSRLAIAGLLTALMAVIGGLGQLATADALPSSSPTTARLATYDGTDNLALDAVDRPGSEVGATRPVAQPSGNAPVSSGGLSAPRAAASNAADFARLTRQLEFDEAASVFTRSGGLQPSVIQGARPIVPGSRIGNPEVIKALTADGSNIANWSKFTTQSFRSPSGPFQVHFYRNTVTGATNYSIDYKVVFGGPR